MTFLFYFQPFLLDGYFITQNERSIEYVKQYTDSHSGISKNHAFYTKDNLPAEATRTWVTKTIAETDSDGTTHYITKLADAYKVSGDSFYMQDGKAVLPLGTLTVIILYNSLQKLETFNRSSNFIIADILFEECV